MPCVIHWSASVIARIFALSPAWSARSTFLRKASALPNGGEGSPAFAQKHDIKIIRTRREACRGDQAEISDFSRLSGTCIMRSHPTRAEALARALWSLHRSKSQCRMCRRESWRRRGAATTAVSLGDDIFDDENAIYDIHRRYSWNEVSYSETEARRERGRRERGAMIHDEGVIAPKHCPSSLIAAPMIKRTQIARRRP